jgi:hypothetical protein
MVFEPPLPAAIIGSTGAAGLFVMAMLPSNDRSR